MRVARISQSTRSPANGNNEVQEVMEAASGSCWNEEACGKEAKENSVGSSHAQRSYD